MFKLPGNLKQSLEMAESLMQQFKAKLERLRDEQELAYVKEEYATLDRGTIRSRASPYTFQPQEWKKHGKSAC